MSAMWSPVFASGVRYDSVRTWVLQHLHPRALLFVAADIHAVNSGPPTQNIEIDPTSHPKLQVALQNPAEHPMDRPTIASIIRGFGAPGPQWW